MNNNYPTCKVPPFFVKYLASDLRSKSKTNDMILEISSKLIKETFQVKTAPFSSQGELGRVTITLMVAVCEKPLQ